MESRVAKTLENHKKGYNCCQAVACAYCDLVGMDEATLFRAAEAFGAGMGGMETTCGAVSGAVLLAGLKNSGGDLENPRTKGGSYRLSKQIVEEFQKKNTTVVCKELKGVETKQALRSCDGCIEDAAAIAERILFAE
ncbi:MAG: C_GCAxxG_C_C family protein [Lachnospiraceae bacterium]|nr:C_GCAxxG_C_C family protein [Lachnospiraceae bacterium]